MEELQLQVVVNPEVDSAVKGVVAFGNFTTEDDTLSTSIYRVTDVRAFYKDLILGRPVGLTFVTRSISNLGVFVSIALFLRRELALHPSMPGIVAAAEMVDAYGLSGLAHIDRDLAKLFRVLRASFLEVGQNDLENLLTNALGWFQDFVTQGQLVATPEDPDPPKILDYGTNGFVVAQSSKCDWFNLDQGWEELYRQGFLRGLLFSPMVNDRRLILVARKSPYLSLDLQVAASALNDAETALEEEPDWVSDQLWLRGPKNGTLLPIASILDLLVRV